MKSLWSRWMWIVLVVVAVAACSDDSGSSKAKDTGTDTTDAAADAGMDAQDAADVAVPSDVASDVADAGDTADAVDIGFLCQPCTANDECGTSDDRCLQLPAGDSGCARSCDPDVADSCPAGFLCTAVDQAGLDHQCVPEKLTCADRCSDVQCADGQVCDPWTGDCKEPLGTCDTGCTSNEVCGNGPEDICVTMPGTNGERDCMTGCNPQAQVSQCPINFVCSPLSNDPNTTEGICVPLAGTCVDRCSNVDCPDGQNCDQLTGQCVTPQYGYCQKGCTSDAECGGQNDVCLALGIGDGAHCWQDCSEDPDVCTDNYECLRLTGTTQSVCLPKGRSCQMCYGTSCYPDGVCDPTSGECVDLPKDCTKVGCPSGELCDPVSTQCVTPGKACSGDSWAADCDNVVTSCTTHRAGTMGTCEPICSSDSDCSTGETCVDTNLYSFCMPADLGGPLTCGTLHDASSPLGKPCGSGQGSCSGSADTCVQAGNLDGFCSMGCSGDADCPAGARCAPDAQGDYMCMPVQCDCAATPTLTSDLLAAWSTALGEVKVSQCDLWLDPALASAMDALSSTPLATALVKHLAALPMAGVEQLQTDLLRLNVAPDVAHAISFSAIALGLQVAPSAGSYTYTGSTSKLTQAVSAFITQAGGTPDTTQLETKAQNVPAGFQDIAAPIISAAADALAARNQALQQAGWSATRQQEAFDGAPYLFLPGTSAQLAAAPDLSDAAVLADYEGFPLQAFAKAAGDLSATVAQATASVGDTSSWTGFSYVVSTPAGVIVLGDANGTVYDPKASPLMAGDIAVVIDAGGNDTYRIPVGANHSVANGVSIAVDLGGSDTYTYNEETDPNDNAALLPSDSDGRQTPAGALNQNNGPVSLSTTARQGAGRLGIGLVFDLGGQDDTYRSLRMSQGAAIFGVGMLYDDGGADSYDAEAFAQGASMYGVSVLWDAGGNDHYRVWHAGQGFGTAGGIGSLRDDSGDDAFEAVTGQSDGTGVLYLSLADRGQSNRNLAQGAGAGIAATTQTIGLGGGVGMLSDKAGADTYTAGTFAQGFGSVRGVGVLSDTSGDDIYNGRASVQGVGELYGGGVFLDQAGGDHYNQSTTVVKNAQGTGSNLGWGFFDDNGGDDTVTYMTPGGGVGLDGGFGFAFFSGGDDAHTSSTPASWGYANNGVQPGSALDGALTVGVFLDSGASTDTYTRPNLDSSVIGDGKTWQQPAVPTTHNVHGVGVDD